MKLQALSRNWQIAKSRARCYAIDQAAHALSHVRYRFPDIHPKRFRIELTRDVVYGNPSIREHRLDVYTPERTGAEQLPVVLYVHGGGFSMLSKDTHRVMALQIARMGYLVFNINYRLGHRHPFPTPLEDAARALLWVRKHAADYGGDMDRFAIAGESAGGNLVTALLALLTTNHPHPGIADELRAADIRVRACVSTYPFLDLTELDRYLAHERFPRLVKAMLFDAAAAYLGPHAFEPSNAPILANPLLLLERTPAHTPLPPFFLSAGTRDPLLGQSRRFKRLLDERGIDCELQIAPGQLHGYDALIWMPAARAKWRGVRDFLEKHLRAHPK